MVREHLYLVAYDIRDPRRLRKVHRVLRGFGEWLQLSLFQCRLNRAGLVELIEALSDVVRDQDALIVVDLGPADQVRPRIVVLAGRFSPLQAEPKIV